LIRWRKMYQCAFVVLHHLRKNPNGYSRSSALDRIRGSSVFSTQSSVVWGAERMDDDTMKVSVEKRRGSSRRGVAHVRYSEQDDKIFLYRI
jgi:hypothetical protein